MMQQATNSSVPSEMYYDESGKPISREEAKKLIHSIPGSYNVALGYTWTWGGLIMRLLGRRHTG